MSKYFDELCRAMKILSDGGYMFCGQAVKYPGTGMFNTLRDVPDEKRMEFPVAENFQMGFCTGASLAGGKICTIYPRINFMIEALPQLIQHLDKIPLFSDFRPHIIIRTAVATDRPLDPGVQHLGHYEKIDFLLSTVMVRRLRSAGEIVPAYEEAVRSGGATLLIEYMSEY